MSTWLEYGKGGQLCRFELVEETAIVGRQRDCALVLNSESVSRRHARFDCDGDVVMVVDLGSRNGTLVNGTKITAPT